MWRAVVVIAAAIGCGRLGFEERATHDGGFDAAPDAVAPITQPLGLMLVESSSSRDVTAPNLIEDAIVPR